MAVCTGQACFARSLFPVAYDALAETTKDKDRVNIRVIPTLLKTVSLSAKRIRPADSAPQPASASRP